MPIESRSLTAKLHYPRIAGDLVARTVLAGARRRKDGAGRGQGTLVGNWSEACDCMSVWRSLDEGNVEVTILCDLSVKRGVKYLAAGGSGSNGNYTEPCPVMVVVKR